MSDNLSKRERTSADESDLATMKGAANLDESEWGTILFKGSFRDSARFRTKEQARRKVQGFIKISNLKDIERLCEQMQYCIERQTGRSVAETRMLEIYLSGDWDSKETSFVVLLCIETTIMMKTYYMISLS